MMLRGGVRWLVEGIKMKNFPPWLTKRLGGVREAEATCSLLERFGLHTVCQSAHCPNIGECFSRGTATFMILGNICTRNCRFCAVETGFPSPPPPEEPFRVAQAVKEMGLKYAVITSVTRDDLPDGGADHFYRTIKEVKRFNPEVKVEVLIPDFKGEEAGLRRVLSAKPEVLNHNLETVPRLYPEVRPGADYLRSLALLRKVKEIAPHVLTKSGLMLGLGEEGEEVIRVMEDLRDGECDLLTLGQYLQPSPRHLPVHKYLTPEEFDEYKRIGEKMGLGVASGPFVRSSYRAGFLYQRSIEGRSYQEKNQKIAKRT